MDIAGRWMSFMASLGAPGGAVGAAFDDLARRHGAPGRHYHTLAHVAECLAELDGEPALCDRRDAVELALWFHDAVYEPRAADNETRSAALLLETAAPLGLDARLARRAASLVMATAHLAGREPGGGEGAADPRRDRDAAAIHDLDLAILGAEPDRFDACETAVRREYAFLPEADWRRGRADVLGTFLAAPRIYLTDALHARLERPARRNLARALSRLG